MSYLYASNLDPHDRSDQLEIQLDSGTTAILIRGHYYDLTANELSRARRYIILTPSSESSSQPVGIVYLPIKGNPTAGQVPAWDATQGAFVPSSTAGGGSGGPARVINAGNLGTTEPLNLAGDPDVWLRGTLNANCVVTVSNLSAGCRFILDLAQDSTGGWTLTVSDGTTSTPVTVPSAPSAAVLVAGYSWNGTDVTLDAGGGSSGGGGVGTFQTELVKAVAKHNGTAYPTRPTGYASVEWIGPTDPGSSAADGDTWIPTA